MIRRALAGAAWLIAGWFARRRAAIVRAGDLERVSFRTQTRHAGFRLTDWARDRLRPGWLKLRQPEAPAAAQVESSATGDAAK